MTYKLPHKTAIFTALATMLITLLSLAAAPAQSAVDADFQRYCRDRFSNSVYERRAESWGVEHYCNQRGTRQNIDLAEACRLTTGAPEFRKEGQRVYCTGNGTPPSEITGSNPPEYRRYCGETFPNSVYERRAGSRGVEHYCRRPGATGGFTLQKVDIAEACRLTRGNSDFTMVNKRVVCGPGTYRFPSGSIYTGPLKNGLPHGIGWTQNQNPTSISISRFRDGKSISPFIILTFRGRFECVKVYSGASPPPQGSQFVFPMSRCAQFQRVLKTIPGAGQ